MSGPETSQPANMQSAAKHFMSASTFAVAGASSLTHKFGYKVFAWYLQHDLHAIPLNPAATEVVVGSKSYDTVRTISKLPDPKNTSLSIITPPPVTMELLKQAKEAGIKAVWIQPGAFGEAESEYALKEFPGAAVLGFEEGTVGGEGWCVLVDGENAMSDASKL
nr:hypothetical protein CFP56_10937 [Quercus suber]POF00914.1 hypothetical protein CFP56_20862 [Quercus suber]